MIKFDCYGVLDDRTLKWHGYISKLVYCGSHLEISIMQAQPIIADVCKTSSGYFVFFARDECGFNLDSLFDIDENADRMSALFYEKKDALSVAFAIGKVGNLLSKPRRKRSPAINIVDEGELPF
jgi:hypothetical protein